MATHTRKHQSLDELTERTEFQRLQHIIDQLQHRITAYVKQYHRMQAHLAKMRKDPAVTQPERIEYILQIRAVQERREGLEEALALLCPDEEATTQ